MEKMEAGTKKKLRWADMEVGANDEMEEDEKMAEEVERAKPGETVFRRRTQN